MNVSRFASSGRFLTAIAAVALLGSLAVQAQDAAYSDPQAAPQADPPSRVGRISVMQGNVSFQPATVNDFSAAEVNYPLTTGDRLYTDSGALAEIQIGNLTARLGLQADFTITSLTSQVAQFGLAQGSVVLESYSLDPDTTTEIDTPNASITVLASGVVRVDYDPQNNVTVVRELSGQVQVDADNVHQMLEGPAQVLRVTGANPSTWDGERLPAPDELDRFSSQRDSYDRQAASAEGSYVGPDVIGSEDLAANGDWDNTADYGAVWYPTTVAADWAPYSVGRWVSIAPWGWTWVGGESWGFAPFHYGRWMRIGNRWGWIPGPVVHPIYSPALVAFVGGPGFAGGVTAWFPLGPGEVYRPWYRASPAYVGRVNTFHNNHITAAPGSYVNRSVATTAIPVRNFGNGRPVRESVVRVDPAQLQGAVVSARPPVGAPQRQVAVRPPARALPPQVARPTMETRGGQNSAVRTPNAPRGDSQPAEIVRPGNSRTQPAATPVQPVRNAPDRSQRGNQQLPETVVSPTPEQAPVERRDSGQQRTAPPDNRNERAPEPQRQPPQQRETAPQPQREPQRTAPQPQAQPRPATTPQRPPPPKDDKKKPQ
jgi:hypothetical protein